MSRATEGKQYRQSKRESMGEIAYKAEEARKRKERRQKARASVVATAPVSSNSEENKAQLNTIIDLLRKTNITSPLDIASVKKKVERAVVVRNTVKGQANCSDLAEAIFLAKKKLLDDDGKGKTIKKESVKQQLKKVENLHKKVTGNVDDCTNYEWVRNTSKVYDFIMNNTKWKSETKNSQLQALSSILGVLDGYDDEYKFYSKASSTGRKELNTEGDKNLLTEAEIAKILPWDGLKNLYRSATDDAEKALIAIYTLIPPRRVKDYQMMKIAMTDLSDDELSDKFNWLLLSKRGIPTQLIFNNYKTVSTFKQQTYQIPRPLASILRKYINDASMSAGEFLFQYKGDMVKPFSRLVIDTFKKYTGKAVSVNILRHSFITNFLNKPNLSIAKRREVATAMAHSVSMQDKYMRIDI